MDKISIVCACDDGYSAHCGTLITSIFENNRLYGIEVYILTDFISDGNRQKFACLSEQYHQEIHIVRIDKAIFQHLPFGGKFENISLATYYRLLMASVLPSGLDKVLYLDCDIIVRADVSDLWNMDVSGVAFAGVEDALPHSIEGPKRLGYDLGESYYNAGVLLVNLRCLREMDFMYRAKEYWENHLDCILMHDQDIINALFHGKIQKMSFQWNMMEPFLMKRPWVLESRREEIEKGVQRPCIVHYTGVLKPWYEESYHPYKDEYWWYCRLSPWQTELPVRKYKGIKSIVPRLKYGVKRFVLPLCGFKKYSFLKLK